MTILALLIALASPQDGLVPPGYMGAEFPWNFREATSAYRRCLRLEIDEAGTRWNGPDPASPFIVQFAQTMTYCHRDRVAAAAKLRRLIQARNPGWSGRRLDKSVDYVLSGFELQAIEEQRRPDPRPVHDGPEPQF